MIDDIHAYKIIQNMLHLLPKTVIRKSIVSNQIIPHILFSLLRLRTSQSGGIC